ncbi:MAG TPA: hypothetical protein VML95_09515 [Longimicrobiales bacterium]|nr:hypothetical protein [Longimicrobiales bacterium]
MKTYREEVTELVDSQVVGALPLVLALVRLPQPWGLRLAGSLVLTLAAALFAYLLSAPGTSTARSHTPGG